MNDVIVIEEVEYSTNAGQGATASGRHGFNIWLKHYDGWMDFLGFITPDRLEETTEYYQDMEGRVEIRYLPHE